MLLKFLFFKSAVPSYSDWIASDLFKQNLGSLLFYNAHHSHYLTPNLFISMWPAQFWQIFEFPSLALSHWGLRLQAHVLTVCLFYELSLSCSRYWLHRNICTFLAFSGERKQKCSWCNWKCHKPFYPGWCPLFGANDNVASLAIAREARQFYSVHFYIKENFLRKDHFIWVAAGIWGGG